MIMRIHLKIMLLMLLLASTLTATGRERVCFDKGWWFQINGKTDIVSLNSFAVAKEKGGNFETPEGWRTVDLPHDWAIEGDFHAGNPSGAGGGALPGGVGWYWKRLSVEELTNEKLLLEFDGVYMNSTVYVNGREAGGRPYGYSSFEVDLTPLLKVGDNDIVVKVDNSDQPNSRWYSGCGIYRHVWLTRVNDTHVGLWGVYVKATPLSKKPTTAKSQFDVTVEVENAVMGMKVTNILLDADGRELKRANGQHVTMIIPNATLWSLENPYLYKVRTEVRLGNELVDTYETLTGVRSFRFDAATGFSLNGRRMKLNGVCEHHDLGCLGAAINEDAMHRKLLKLKEMGVNAIRCSHNPPAPQLLDMCDTMGLVVMDEAFDMWRRKKTQNDYARYFDEWHERDLTDLVKRDRNHPSVIMWSIGNEVLEQWSSAEADTLTLEQANLILNAGHDASTLAKDGETSVQSLLTRHLADIVKRYDTSRPITAGCNEPSPNNHLFKSGALDIIGFNYHHQWVKDVPTNFPGKPFLFSESVSALQTRGYYMMPSDSVYVAPKEWWLPYTDPSMMCSAYDNMHASWSSTHEETWDVVKHNDFVGGQFIWTGFDYIGEPTPYGFPARSSYFGIIDLAGFPKDTYYMYQSEWTQKPVLHLFPHWNWLPGQTIDMWCYYNQADEVELFINGKSQGVRRKGNEPLCTEYHVAWRVTYEPGEVTVVARQDGREVRRQTIRTAEAATGIQMNVDYQGRDLCFVEVDIVDNNGTICPLAENQVFFETDGLEIVGVDNGCQTSMERFKDNKRKAFFGKCLVVVKGKGRLTAKGVGLKDAAINIQ